MQRWRSLVALVLCRKLCRLMGGDVTVASALEKGSVFTVTLPIERQQV